MKKQLLCLSILGLSLSTSAHTMAPGEYQKHHVFGEVNAFEFTIANRNNYTSDFEVLVYDATASFDAEGKRTIHTEPDGKVVGTIEELTYNRSFKFTIDVRARESDTTHKVVCTRMKRETGYRSEVCSLIVMERF